MLMPRQCRPITLLAALVLSVSGDLPARSSGHTIDAQAPAAQPPQPSADPAPARPAWDDLAHLFEPGGMLQDRNGDHVIDFVDARLLLGDTPIAADVIAAANIAARLGFETSAINLPLTAATSGTPVVIGSAGAARVGLSVREVVGGALRAREGAVAMVHVGNTSGVAVVSADDDGLRAAAETLAGRLPHLWDPGGPTLATVAADLRSFLASKGVEIGRVRVPLVRVQAGARELELVTLEARVASRGTLLLAEAALGQTLARRSAKPASGAAAPPLSYGGVRTVRVRLVTDSGGDQAVVDVPRAGPPTEAVLGRRQGGGTKDGLDLSSLYSNTGLLGDSDGNLIPDRVDAVLVPHGGGIEPVIDLAARIGLESTGVSFPLVVPVSSIEKPEAEPILVLIGAGHPLIDRLVKAGKVDLRGLQPGEGLIRVVQKAFGDRSALVVTGSDAGGVTAALHEMAERWPNLNARGKDRTTLGDVEEDMRRCLSGRSPIGQAATALYKLDRLTAPLAGKDLESAAVHVYVQQPAPGLDEIVRRQAAAALGATPLRVDVGALDVEHAKAVLTDEFDVPSEVDDFWRAFRSRVIPAVRKGQPVVLEARLSEPAEVRARIGREARQALLKAGAADAGTRITVLSAYKQGYSWLYDVVRPALAGKAIGDLTIRFAEIGPPPEWKYQTSYTPTRWLLEIYPIDEILARELPLDLSHIHFEKAPIGAPAYEVMATGPDGATLFRQTFEPRFVVRDFFDQFPNYEKARVTTGWLNASVGGRPVVDQRIETDTERFWDHFQSKTLPALYEYVMTLTEGKPMPEDAPFFGELRVDVSLSEPDEPLPVDQERIAPMESLHEEIYFNTLHFFEVLGRFTGGAPLQFVGRVIPLVRPKADGTAGHARITLTGFGSPRPAVLLDYTVRGQRPASARLDIPKVAVENPAALGAVVRVDRPGLTRLDLRVEVDTDKDEWDAFIQKATEKKVEQIMSAEEVTAIVENVQALRAAGLYRDALAYHDLGTISITEGWQYEPDPKADRAVTLAPNGTPAAWPDLSRHRPEPEAAPGTPLVQWDTPMSPDEAFGVLARMASWPEATVYKAGESYLGQDIWAMDLMSPIEASHWSPAKATTFKPTLMYTGRQHGNEVSATSHILKLAERLLTDPARRRILDHVNLVVLPVTNADGARLDAELIKLTPHYILHAGYNGALGVNMTQGQWSPDGIYPEGRVRPRLFRAWLPDAVLDGHGYPSHEWIQMFSEYAPWVRSRIVETRDYSTMRGWWQPRFDWLDDPRYPRHRDEEFRIRDVISKAINAVPEVNALNARAYDRYRRYTFAFDQTRFKLNFADGVLTYTDIKGSKPSASVNSYMRNYPNVTVWDGASEAPDETASGDWLRLVCTAGLTWDEAVLDYYASGHEAVERKGIAFQGGVSLGVNRPRPPKPADKKKETS
jgi:hypothetical protein